MWVTSPRGLRWRARRLARRFQVGQAGVSTVEFAFALMLSLYLILGVVDFGRAFALYNAVSNTAREGARYGTIAGRTDGQIVSYSLSKSGGFATIAVTVPDLGTPGSSADPVVVQASAAFVPITPLLSQICCGGGSLTVTARSSMYVEPY
jgi:Flp pilus assembly protein TadG